MLDDAEMLEVEARWCVVRTHPQKEGVAAAALAAQEFLTFCPMVQSTVRRSRRFVERPVPLFRGYIFVALGQSERRWRPINSTPGVQYLLADNEGHPSRLPTSFVRELQSRTNGEGIFSVRDTLCQGERVRVRSGPFSDLVGRIEQLDFRGRASVLLELMSRAVRVDLPVERLDRASRSVAR